MDDASKEYLTQFLDYYQAGSSSDGCEKMGEIVGYLKEFMEQQESGQTSFIHVDEVNTWRISVFE